MISSDIRIVKAEKRIICRVKLNSKSAQRLSRLDRISQFKSTKTWPDNLIQLNSGTIIHRKI